MNNFFLKNFLFSTRVMAFLFILFAVAMGLGTFIESWYSTATARLWIYDTWWFESIMLFLGVNFFGNIWRYRLYQRKKWATLLLHLSFIGILLGAFVTRYVGFEGVMPIREGETTDFFLSEKTYLTVVAQGDINGQTMQRLLQKELLITPEAQRTTLPWKSDFNGVPFSIEYTGFIKGAEEGFIPDENGAPYLKLVEASGGGRHEHYLKEGEIANIHNVLFTLNNPVPGAINIIVDGENYTLSSPFGGTYMRMADQLQGEVIPDSIQPLMLRSLYNFIEMQFVIPEPITKGYYGVVEAKEKVKDMPDALILTVSSGTKKQEVTLLGGKGYLNSPTRISMEGIDFELSYGSKRIELPFSLTLKDFIAEKQPGAEKSYASFMSKLTVNDDPSFDYDIYMNHVLDHKGYRFFQASFDPDEKGTVLSVNHDRPGTILSYSGYFMLFFAMMAVLFDRNTRFAELKRKLQKVKAKKILLVGILILSGQNANAQDSIDLNTGHNQILFNRTFADSMILRTKVSQEHADAFGKLIIQDEGGRMKPANTFSSELLRKVSKDDHYKDMDSDQVLLSMTLDPRPWYSIPIIYLKRGNDSLRHILNLAENTKYAAVTDFFDRQGNYLLATYLEKAYRTAIPNQFEKDYIEADRRLNLLASTLNFENDILRIFPVPNDPINTWVSHWHLQEHKFPSSDEAFVDKLFPTYMISLKQALETGDYSQANQLLEGLKNFQKKYGAAIYPPEEKIQAEVLYNRYDIFKRLFIWFMLSGLFMLLLVIIEIFYNSKVLGFAIKVVKLLVWGLFLIHTGGLILRWYISGHAPWSDAYESMIYVAWATLFFGLAFGRKSNLTIGATAFVASIILMVAHWNWMDPSIANLQPVLNSYWLMIHVAVIVASYGPFTLGMILGILALLLLIFTKSDSKKKLQVHIQEITIINEMALTVGLIMLTIGNFLGGMWANESWGRYWGWDPKETWALISIMVYAFVIHARLVPGLRGPWTFNFLSIIAFSSIMMTYFGVNFYLVGLHSYASGDKVITPNFVYYSLLIVAILAVLSYLQFKKYYSKN